MTLTLATLLVAAGGGGAAADAYPIDPVPLRQLVQSTPLIAVATAGETVRDPQESDDFFGPTHRTEVVVLEVLKGDCKPDERLQVWTSGDMICPTPARFEQGATHMVFLAPRDDGGWRSVALSYGVKTMKGEAKKEAYRRAVRSLLRVEAMPEGSAEEREAKQAARLQWIVDTAADPYTRWEGAVELNARRYLPTGMSVWPYSVDQLDRKQRDRLATALERSATHDYADQQLFEALADMRHPALDRWLAGYIESWGDEPPYKRTTWLGRAVMRAGVPELEREFRLRFVQDLDGDWEWIRREEVPYDIASAARETYLNNLPAKVLPHLR